MEARLACFNSNEKCHVWSNSVETFQYQVVINNKTDTMAKKAPWLREDNRSSEAHNAGKWTFCFAFV